MNKSSREIIMGFSIFHLPREGQPAKQTRKFKRWSKDKKKEKSQISLLGSPTKPTYNQNGTWKQKGGDQVKGQSTQRNHKKLDLSSKFFRKENNPQSRSLVKVLLV